MGLDITSYSKVKLVQGKNENIDCLWGWMESEGLDGTVLYPNKSFPIQSEGLEEGVYTFEDVCDVDFSCSYGGWSNIRNKLAKACGYNKSNVESMPYQQSAFNQDGCTRLNLLLNFSDCEGVINTTCCKIIAEDLAWLEENKTLDSNLAATVSDLRNMFEFAGYHNGVVEFH